MFRRFCLRACSRDENDRILLQSDSLEVELRICIADVIHAHAISLGDGEQRLLLQYDMRIINLSVAASDLFYRDGDRSLSICLGIRCSLHTGHYDHCTYACLK